ncbi:MAG: hypothetical protein NC411_10675 [Bacteroides sp.]|nr:hypothetical protein [Bacteroides sp.]
MNQTKTVLSAIVEFLLGKKYYANIINSVGTDNCEISSFIFDDRQNADKHRQEINSTRSYQWVETISFRSHSDFGSTSIKRYNTKVPRND